jgi:hypothetical protein
VIDGKEGCLDNMRFDLVVMNPPFSAGKNGTGVQLWKKVVAVVSTVCPRAVFVLPDNCLISWPVGGGATRVARNVQFEGAPSASVVLWGASGHGVEDRCKSDEVVAPSFNVEVVPSPIRAMKKERGHTGSMPVPGDCWAIKHVGGRVVEPGGDHSNANVLFRGADAERAARWVSDNFKALAAMNGGDARGRSYVTVAFVRAVIDGAKRRK